jgi:transposase-like protein
MRALAEREQALNLYFHEGRTTEEISRALGIPRDTVKSWCHRYRVQNGIPERGKAPLTRMPLAKETVRVLTPRETNTPEARIARLEMEVELLRNFLILTEGK